MDALTLKIELVRRGVRQTEVADRLGIDKDLLSKRLLGTRPMPEGFDTQVLAAVHEIAQEHAAAIKAEADRRIARLLGEDADSVAANVAA